MKSVVLLKSNLCTKGGVEKYTLKLADAFSKKGSQVTILTTNLKNKQITLPYNIVNLCKGSKITFLHLKQYDKKCRHWLKEHPCDIVFGMDRNSYQSHYRAGNGVHAEYLLRRMETDSFFKKMSFKMNPLHRFILNMEKKTYENPYLEKLFTNSHMVRNEILKHYKTPKEKIHVVHNGVEWVDMQPAFYEWPQKQAEILSNLGLDPTAFQFLFIGKGFRRKGLHYLLEGLSLLKDNHFQLSVVGKDKEIKGFMHLAHKLGLQKKVKFFGHRDDTTQFYQACDVLAIPSTYDPFANVTVEALAMGLFVVSSKHNGGAEVLTPNSGAIIENLYDKDSFLTALESAMEHKKTPHKSKQIRDSVKHLDFSLQLNQIVTKTSRS